MSKMSKEEVVHLAHCVIQMMQCEWEGCTTTLNSWDTLAKHLLRHCSRVIQHDGMFQCSYSRCSGRLHNSSAALKTHIELSHLSRVALPCPARGCKEVFVRVQQLSSHFEHVHHELLGKRVSMDMFAPLAILSSPRHLQVPPPLPRCETRTASFLPSVSVPPIRRAHRQATTSQRLSRRWSRLNVQDEANDENPIVFENLPSLRAHDIIAPKVVDIEVRERQPLAMEMLLSRPQPVIPPPVRCSEPEQAILYSAFERMVDKLVAAGTLAGHKEMGM